MNQPSVTESPPAKLLGLPEPEFVDGRAVAAFTVHDAHTNSAGMVHGGEIVGTDGKLLTEVSSTHLPT